MKYVALLSGGKDSCFNLVHCQRNGHELIAAASLGPELGKGLMVQLDFGSLFFHQHSLWF
jgi:diphthamide synthase (EF-2-diphthine--ammonia ligase)